LANGADINAKENCGGATALIRASKEGHLDIVRELLARGAEVNAMDNAYRTALSVAPLRKAITR
jgi:ankyrin